MKGLKALAAMVERSVPPIARPSHKLEQYTTPGELAALIALEADRRGHCGWAADLGAGSCRLAVALAIACGYPVVAVDADFRLSRQCLEGAETAGVEDLISFVNSWITADSGPLAPGQVELVVTNPPFGVVRRGADWEILSYAMGVLKPGAVYAILKAGNLEFHARRASHFGYRLEVLVETDFPIPASMEHHRSRIRRIDVDVVVFQREGTG